MKNYKVKAIKYFIDAIENMPRNIDDEFMVTEERYKELKKHNAVELIIEESEKIEVEEKPKKTKRTRKEK